MNLELRKQSAEAIRRTDLAHEDVAVVSQSVDRLLAESRLVFQAIARGQQVWNGKPIAEYLGELYAQTEGEMERLRNYMAAASYELKRAQNFSEQGAVEAAAAEVALEQVLNKLNPVG